MRFFIRIVDWKVPSTRQRSAYSACGISAGLEVATAGGFGSVLVSSEGKPSETAPNESKVATAIHFLATLTSFFASLIMLASLERVRPVGALHLRIRPAHGGLYDSYTLIQVYILFIPAQFRTTLEQIFELPSLLSDSRQITRRRL